MSNSIDHSDATFSHCNTTWTGKLKEAKKISKISFVYLKWVDHTVPKVSIGIKDEKLTSCKKHCHLAPNIYHFYCDGHLGDKVEIEMNGDVFDVRVFCKFRIFFVLNFNIL